jgi:hypothetical protein
MTSRREWAAELRARDGELFPRLVRRPVLIALWIVLAVAVGALVWIGVAVAS